MNRLIKYFLITWVCVFVVTFFTADDISFISRLLFSAGLACVVPFLSLGNRKGKDDNRRKSNDLPKESKPKYTVHTPLNPHILYRVEGNLVYREYDATPTYEIKGDKIYERLASKPTFHIENGNVYKCYEVAPILTIKGNKIYKPLSSKVLYEIHTCH